MTLTSENVARYLRTALQLGSGALISYGMVSPGASWIEPTIGLLVSLGSFAWTLYGNRVQALVNEVAAIEVTKPSGATVLLVQSMKVSDVSVATAAPDNVTATTTAASTTT